MRDGAEEWRNKVHPTLFKIAEVNKEVARHLNALGQNPSKASIKNIYDKAERGLTSIRKELPKKVDGTPYALTLTAIFNQDPVKGFLEWLCWNRFRKPLWKLLKEAEGGNAQATYQWIRLQKDYADLRYGKSIKKFKTHLDHCELMEAGWGLGLQTLTAEELAACFDNLCTCGVEAHDADSLRKLRTWYKKKIRELVQVRESLGKKPKAASRGK
jgi:hypothetical protein